MGLMHTPEERLIGILPEVAEEVPQALIPRYVNTMGFSKVDGDKGHMLIKAAVKIANSGLGSTLCLQYSAPVQRVARHYWQPGTYVAGL